MLGWTCPSLSHPKPSHHSVPQEGPHTFFCTEEALRELLGIFRALGTMSTHSWELPSQAVTHGCSSGSWVAESRPAGVSLEEDVESVSMVIGWGGAGGAVLNRAQGAHWGGSGLGVPSSSGCEQRPGGANLALSTSSGGWTCLETQKPAHTPGGPCSGHVAALRPCLRKDVPPTPKGHC